ncbi:MAG: hydroxyacid dehydrogenase [Marinovum sp.]|nr:hydroxyacid dehydrogenase [Marinovum sp.]
MILITEFMDTKAIDRLSAAHPTTYAPELADSQDQIPALMSGVQALIVRNRTQVTKDLLTFAPDLKCVGRLGVGLDNIDLDACEALGVKVIPASGANNLSVAEYVVSNALALLRNAYQVNTEMLAGTWPRLACAGREVSGKTMGLIGYGAIARETAQRAAALGMNISAYDPFLQNDDPVWTTAHRKTLTEVLQTSDVISLHVPLTDDTRHLINKESLSQMKSGAVLINAARGGVVDEAALAASLENGQIAGAALDVFETEPLSKDSAAKFLGLNNLILTPHIAGVTEESNIRVSSMIADCVLDTLR